MRGVAARRSPAATHVHQILRVPGIGSLTGEIEKPGVARHEVAVVQRKREIVIW